MINTKEDNTIAVLQRAIRHFRIPVTNGTIRESLKAHPQYPTFKSICDVLNEWEIENYPVRYKPDEIKGIKSPFIAHLKADGGQLVFVTRINNEAIYYFDSYKTKRTNTLNDFLEMCSGAVVLINPTEKSGEREFRIKKQNEILKRMLLPAIIGTILIFAIVAIITLSFQDSLYINKIQYLLFLTKAMGIALSVLLIFQEFDIHTSIGDKICHINKNTSCNTVLNDKASKIFGWFGWADIGFIYFLGGFLALLQTIRTPDFSLLALVSALALPYPVYSIYYQGFILKKWCPLCLGVQLILIFEFLLLIPYLKLSQLTFSEILSFIFTFWVVGIIYTLFNMYYREKVANATHYQKYLGFRKNPDVLKALLFSQPHYNIPVTNHSLLFGSEKASSMITAFLSLHCSPCARAFRQIRKVLSEDNGIKVFIILIASDLETLNAIYYLNEQNRKKEAMELLEQYYERSPSSSSDIYEKYNIPVKVKSTDEITKENYKLYKDCNVNGTPTIYVNGYLLHKQYDIEDLKHISFLPTIREEQMLKQTLTH